VLVMAAAPACRFFIVSWIGERTVADLRLAVHRNLLRQSPAFCAARRPAEITSRGQGGAKAVLSARPASVGQGQGSRASGPKRSGTRRKGAPSRSAMPNAWFAVPARGSSSTQMASRAPSAPLSGSRLPRGSST